MTAPVSNRVLALFRELDSLSTIEAHRTAAVAIEITTQRLRRSPWAASSRCCRLTESGLDCRGSSAPVSTQALALVTWRQRSAASLPRRFALAAPSERRCRMRVQIAGLSIDLTAEQEEDLRSSLAL